MVMVVAEAAPVPLVMFAAAGFGVFWLPGAAGMVLVAMLAVVLVMVLAVAVVMVLAAFVTAAHPAIAAAAAAA